MYVILLEFGKLKERESSFVLSSLNFSTLKGRSNHLEFVKNIIINLHFLYNSLVANYLPKVYRIRWISFVSISENIVLVGSFDGVDSVVDLILHILKIRRTPIATIHGFT